MVVEGKAELAKPCEVGGGAPEESHSEYQRQPSTRFGVRGSQVDQEERKEILDLNSELQKSERERTLSQHQKPEVQ